MCPVLVVLEWHNGLGAQPIGSQPLVIPLVIADEVHLHAKQEFTKSNQRNNGNSSTRVLLQRPLTRLQCMTTWVSGRQRTYIHVERSLSALTGAAFFFKLTATTWHATGCTEPPKRSLKGDHAGTVNKHKFQAYVASAAQYFPSALTLVAPRATPTMQCLCHAVFLPSLWNSGPCFSMQAHGFPDCRVIHRLGLGGISLSLSLSFSLLCLISADCLIAYVARSRPWQGSPSSLSSAKPPTIKNGKRQEGSAPNVLSTVRL